MWSYWNPNPSGRDGIDCTVRALSKALDIPWEKAYTMLAVKGFALSDMPNANHVYAAVLRENGFTRHVIPDSCPDCYTAEDFAEEHQTGTYILAFGDHVCCVEDGTIFDSWQSGSRMPMLYWEKQEEKG